MLIKATEFALFRMGSKIFKPNSLGNVHDGGRNASYSNFTFNGNVARAGYQASHCVFHNLPSTASIYPTAVMESDFYVNELAEDFDPHDEHWRDYFFSNGNTLHLSDGNGSFEKVNPDDH